MDKETVKKIRTKALMTQKEFGEIVGVHANVINRWENGRSGISFAHQRKIIAFCKENGIDFENI